MHQTHHSVSQDAGLRPRAKPSVFRESRYLLQARHCKYWHYIQSYMQRTNNKITPSFMAFIYTYDLHRFHHEQAWGQPTRQEAERGEANTQQPTGQTHTHWHTQCLQERAADWTVSIPVRGGNLATFKHIQPAWRPFNMYRTITQPCTPKNAVFTHTHTHWLNHTGM